VLKVETEDVEDDNEDEVVVDDEAEAEGMAKVDRGVDGDVEMEEEEEDGTTLGVVDNKTR